MVDLPYLEPFDLSDPKQHLAWALASFPAPQQDSHPVPIPAGARPSWSEVLYKLGFRFHPELMELFPIPGNQPNMGPYNVPTYVGGEEYDTYLANRAAAPPPTQERDPLADALALLAAIDPDQASRISSMSDEEKAAALAAQEGKVPDALAKLIEMRKLMESEAPE